MTEPERRTMRAECERRTRMMFIPRERQGIFRTSDNETYHRDADTGVIRRLNAKVRGKSAHRVKKSMRRQARRMIAAKLAESVGVPTTTSQAPTVAAQS